jgi:deoxyribose-phosphate aldolase
MMDLTTPEAGDTEGKVRAICAGGYLSRIRWDLTISSVAAICTYPAYIPVAKRMRSRALPFVIASVATGFHQPMQRRKILETRQAVEAGADEIGIWSSTVAVEVIGTCLTRSLIKEACGPAPEGDPETGEPRCTTTSVARASWQWLPGPTYQDVHRQGLRRPRCP